MDRLNQLSAGGEAGCGDSTLDTSSSPSEGFVSANESSSKYFSLSDSTFDIDPIKDVSLASVASTASEADRTMTSEDELISNLSPITKKDVMLESYKMGKQIEAANILSGGVDIFDDNDNSYDGDELVIDDNVELDEKSNLDKSDSQFKGDETAVEATLVDSPLDVASRDTEVVLQIDGNNVDAIDIGNGLYLYRKDGQEELAAVQIITEDDQQQPSFKFLKVRENAEGNLEVYEEFEIEVTKEVSAKDSKQSVKKTSHTPIKEINRVISDASSNKVTENIEKTSPKEEVSTSAKEVDTDVKEITVESKTEINFNGKMKFSESRKSPVVGSFTPMTYHSTPNKEGKPLTKTMVDLQLHPNRHSDNVKKTIEVHTDSQNKKIVTDEFHKPKLETQAMKSSTDNTITKEKISTESLEESSDVTEKSGKDPQVTDNISSCSANIKPGTDKLSHLIGDVSKKLLSPTLINVDSITKVEDIVTIDIENKQIEAETSLPKNEERHIQDTDNKDIDDPKPMSTTVDALSTTNSTHNPVLEIGSSEKIPSASKEVNTESLLTKDLFKSGSVKEVNKDATTMLESKTVDNLIVKSQAVKTNEQKEDNTICEMCPEIATSNVIDSQSPHQDSNVFHPKTHIDVILQKGSHERPDEVGVKHLQLHQTLKPLPEFSSKDSKASDKIIEENKIPIIPSVPTMEMTTSKHEFHDDNFAIVAKTVPTISPNEGESDQKSKNNTAKKDVQLNEGNKSTGSTENKSDANTDKYKQLPKAELHTVAAESACNTSLETKSSISPSNVEITTVSEIDKMIGVPKEITCKPHSVQSKTEIISSSASGPKKVLTMEKYDPVSKAPEQKAVTKTEKLIVSKDIASNLISTPESLNTVPKTEPITVGTCTTFKPVSKTESTSLVEKEIVTKAASKTEMFNPVGIKIDTKCETNVEKEIVTKAASKTKMFNPVGIKIDPKSELNVEKFNAVATDILNTKTTMDSVKSNKNYSHNKEQCTDKNETRVPEVSISGAKPMNNNHAAVPFGKWTDANRQEFLSKFKDIKIPAPSNTKQIKNSNDLNRIDVLKKIDSQRSNNASSKPQDKSTVKDTVFSNKIAPPKVTKIPVKTEGPKIKPKPETVVENNTLKQDSKIKEKSTSLVVANVGTSAEIKPGTEERRNVNVNMTNLITRTIVDMLNRPVPMTMCKSSLSEPKPRPIENTDVKVTSEESYKNSNSDVKKLDDDSSGSLDDIEMKMNELHGIPFVERPPHELPRLHKTYSKTSKDSNLAKKVQKKPIFAAPTTSIQSLTQTIIDVDSDDELIEHEPVTGDTDLNKKKLVPVIPASVKTQFTDNKTVPTSQDPQKKNPVITENDFDKFARRNSITYENCLTVKFDGKEPANVVQTVKEKDAKPCPRNEKIRVDPNTKLPCKQYTCQNVYVGNVSHIGKFGSMTEDPNSKNYQSKIATAYQSALSSKRQIDRPITIIEDKPVKVVFMDANAEFVPNQLNVQGKELSPAKKPASDVDAAVNNAQSINIDVMDAVDDSKQLDDMKTKTKHQRKQVLTPVEAPDLELIQPGEIGIDATPKKKRKTDDNKTEKNLKSPVHKKQYLLGRSNVTGEKTSDINNPEKETSRSEIVPERSAVSAIDSLVKAAELLENQSVESSSPNPDSQQSTPVKRGRGRPRKYPLPEGATDSKVASPSPQKKPRLIDAKPVKDDSVTDDNESTDEEEITRENWTMGKINENIVCPICNKLFRSENVVFKHVKHCTGVSPSRSESEKMSPRRRRHSRESDNKSFESKSDHTDVDEKLSETVIKTPTKRKSHESVTKHEGKTGHKDNEIIVSNDTPVKDQVNKILKENPENEIVVRSNKEPTNKKEISVNKLGKVKKLTKTNFRERSSDLVCEFCGKTFRQLSYLVNHKLQHRKEQKNKLETNIPANKIQVFSCEVCKKEFRKLHHLVQHRIIHNLEVPTRTLRKSSSEQTENKNGKEQATPKQNDDTSAGFRCEPCDKSFRKLHHLVEHRETHDGINRQKNTSAQAIIEKLPPPPTCEVCKKTFRKLSHLIEHKEQHVEQVETSSEKSDDKSVKSSLSTKDIIHECSLCYMVFPNEHSLNKHFVICQQKKKRQSKQKEKSIDVDDPETVEESPKSGESLGEDNLNDTPEIVVEEIIDDDDEEVKNDRASKTVDMTQKDEEEKIREKPVDIEIKPSETVKVSCTEVSENPAPKEKQDKPPEAKIPPLKRELPISNNASELKKVVPEKVKKIDHQQVKESTKKTLAKDKVAPSVSRRQKSSATPLATVPEGKPVESSDDDDVRYMLNPDFQATETSGEKTFMKVRSNKRNSLQIERPNSRDLMKRRTSLQHPPKIPRLKAKAVEPKLVPTSLTKNDTKISKLEATAFTDSDDSDVKYSFPDKVPHQSTKPIPQEKPKDKPVRKSLVEKRKSLSGIAKRKSMGLKLAAKLKPNSPPVRVIKRRTLEVEHRCDCGQLFNSAALLTRHTSLAHTPPRIRRRRSPPPPPPPPAETSHKTARKLGVKGEPSNSNVKPTRKSSVKADTASGVRNSSVRSELSPDARKRTAKGTQARGGVHRGVPVPDRMRKLMMKNAK